MGTRYKRVNKTVEYYYNINQFEWSQAENTFYAFAPSLVAILPDYTIHPYAFANMKEQFFIINPETGERRRFRFVKEGTKALSDLDIEYDATYWLFESEDGIKCKVWIT